MFKNVASSGPACDSQTSVVERHGTQMAAVPVEVNQEITTTKTLRPDLAQQAGPAAASAYSGSMRGVSWVATAVLWFLVTFFFVWILLFTFRPKWVLDTTGTNLDLNKLLMWSLGVAFLVLVIGAIVTWLLRGCAM